MFKARVLGLVRLASGKQASRLRVSIFQALSLQQRR
ncbi:unnamed protein product, partial [marine sediment metagenome]